MRYHVSAGFSLGLLALGDFARQKKKKKRRKSDPEILNIHYYLVSSIVG